MKANSIGPNGTKRHGPNSVISNLDHYLIYKRVSVIFTATIVSDKMKITLSLATSLGELSQANTRISHYYLCMLVTPGAWWMVISA
jgi:hypothetical protein